MVFALTALGTVGRVPGSEARATQASPAAGPAPQVKPAADGVFDLFKQKQVVALGDVHSLAQEEAFHGALVRDPRFADQVGNVVVEFGGSGAQDTIDRYVKGEKVPVTELRHVWTDVVGWFPRPYFMGFINFFPNVRAANMKLPRDRRIKVWLGDPGIDWSKIHDWRDCPSVVDRDPNFFRLISKEILDQHKKALLIVGASHFRRLDTMINGAYPNSTALVTTFFEPQCTAKITSAVQEWPSPAVIGPVAGTWLQSELRHPGCGFKYEFSNAILYLDPRYMLTMSPIDPNAYLDPDYCEQLNHRMQVCGPSVLDWDWFLHQNSQAPKPYDGPL